MGHKLTLESKSKYLSRLLRHKPEALDLDMDIKGWVHINELITKGAFSLQEILDIVKNDQKGRYELSEDKEKVRAVSGHSIPWVDPDLQEVTEVPKELYHGTSRENLNEIKKSGYIKKMSRNYIHLTDSKEDAWETGKRHGTPCILVIDSESLYNDGYKFYRPQGNRYYFCKTNIPVLYIKDIIWSYM